MEKQCSPTIIEPNNLKMKQNRKSTHLQSLHPVKEHLALCLLCCTEYMQNDLQLSHINSSWTSITQRLVHVMMTELIPDFNLEKHNCPPFICMSCLQMFEKLDEMEVQIETLKDTIKESYIRACSKFMNLIYQQESKADERNLESITKTQSATKTTLICENKNFDWKLERSRRRKSSSSNFVTDTNKLISRRRGRPRKVLVPFTKESMQSSVEVQNSLDKKLCPVCRTEISSNQICCDKDNCINSNEDVDRRNALTEDTIKCKNNKVNSKNKWKCHLCLQKFTSSCVLELHVVQKHSSLLPFLCVNCGLRFKTKSKLQSHNTSHQNGDLQCPICSVKFQVYSQLNKHTLLKHNSTKKFTCPHCSLEKVSLRMLDLHIKLNHSDILGAKTYTCNQCSKSFITGDALAHHSNKCFVSNVSCPHCSKAMARNYLSVHINAVHTKEKVFACDKCKKEFYSLTSLNGHTKRSHKQRKHLCHLCGKSFTHNVELQRHLKCHANQRDFKCDECDKAYFKKSDLNYHKQTHDSSKIHKCKICHFATTEITTHKNHIKTHTSTGLLPAKTASKIVLQNSKTGTHSHSNTKEAFETSNSPNQNEEGEYFIASINSTTEDVNSRDFCDEYDLVLNLD